MPDLNDSITFNFPHPLLTRVTGKPTIHSLKNVKKELFANAHSVYSLRGSGQHGHVILVLTDAAHQTLTGQNFVAPVHPGAQAVLPQNGTARTIAEAKDAHAHALKEFNTYNQLDQALKAQLIAAVEPKYIESLAHPMYGFANLSARDIIAHLNTKYIKLTPDIMRKNLEGLSAPFEAGDTLDPLWMRASTAIVVATEGNDPITNATLIRTFQKVLKDTGVFEQDLRDWENKAEADKTWDNFKIHFDAANEYRLENMTAEAAGFHGANNTEHQANAAVHTGQSPNRNNALVDPMSLTWGYCWTHGCGRNSEHTSLTCTNKAPGHQDDATMDNMKGGNNTIRRRRNERPVYRRPQNDQNGPNPAQG